MSLIIIFPTVYIRNHYIHNKDFLEVSFWVEPDDLSSKINRMIFSKLLPEYDNRDYIPVEVCFLPYKKEIGHNRYVDYRRSLSRQLEEYPYLVKRLDAAYFKDRVLTKAALKYGWTLKYLTMYQNDDAMVKYCILHNGESIQYAAERFQTDREWVRLAKQYLHFSECTS